VNVCQCGVWGFHERVYKTRRAAVRYAESWASVDGGTVYEVIVVAVQDGFQVMSGYKSLMCPACIVRRMEAAQ
jgi:hypothetical protein